MDTLYIPEITDKAKIDKILKHQCVNCGGELAQDGEHYRCRYCNTEYSVKPDYSMPGQYIIKIVRPGVRVCAGRFFIPDEHKKYMGDHFDDFIKHQVIKSMSEYIYEHFDELVEMESEQDFGEFGWQHGTVYMAKMRMLDKVNGGDCYW